MTVIRAAGIGTAKEPFRRFRMGSDGKKEDDFYGKKTRQVP